MLELDKDFKEVKGNYRMPKNQCSVSRYCIYFNAANEEYFRRQDYAQIYYSRKRNIIAVRPTQVESPGHQKVARPRCGGIRIPAGGFLRKNVLDFKRTKRFQITWEPRYHCFFIYLGKEVK